MNDTTNHFTIRYLIGRRIESKKEQQCEIEYTFNVFSKYRIRLEKVYERKKRNDD